MRRILHGGGTRPGLNRPGNGFGRPLRPGPGPDARILQPVVTPVAAPAPTETA